ncbi:MAG: hypothetical protein ABIK28_14525 [Planctomycetota bacterium]
MEILRCPSLFLVSISREVTRSSLRRLRIRFRRSAPTCSPSIAIISSPVRIPAWSAGEPSQRPLTEMPLDAFEEADAEGEFVFLHLHPPPGHQEQFVIGVVDDEGEAGEQILADQGNGEGRRQFGEEHGHGTETDAAHLEAGDAGEHGFLPLRAGPLHHDALGFYAAETAETGMFVEPFEGKDQGKGLPSSAGLFRFPRAIP